MSGRCLRSLVVLAVALVALPLARVPAAEPDWPATPYGYITVEQDLPSVLREFASGMGLTIQISPQVTGVVRGRLPSLPPREFLETLARTYGLTWYYDGYVLYVYSLEEAESRVIRLESIDVEELRTALRDFAIYDERFPFRRSDAGNVVYVSGPPRYVELVEQAADRLDVGLTVRVDIRAFPLRYAAAADRVFTIRGEPVLVPGIASILRRVAGADNSSDVFARTGGVRNLALVRSVTDAMGVSEPRTIEEARAAGVLEGAAAVAGEAEVLGLARREDTIVEIEADRRTNSVIVKDFTERMPIYERLIAQLDQPQKLVELELVIADINSSRLVDLGVDWNFGFSRGSTDINLGVGNPSIPAPSDGLTFATAITGNPLSFLSRIRALESEGDARVLSRPTVMTFDNVEAVFDQSESFFVRLEGENEVDLVQIQVGTLVRVTPHLIDEPRRTRVQMTVDVEDGTVNPDATVDDLPTVLRATLSTQGIVDDAQALVIGGFYREEQLQALARVPLLSDIPILGWALFRNKSTEQTSVVRLFVIRPVVIADDTRDRLVSGRYRSGPRRLVPPGPGPATPSAAMLRQSIRWGVLLDRQAQKQAGDAVCLAFAGMEEFCRPSGTPLFVEGRREPFPPPEAQPDGPRHLVPGLY